MSAKKAAGADTAAPHSPRASASLIHGNRRVTLEWRTLGLSVAARGSTKTVLESVSGVARPGELVALMGPSGAGKSSLLNALAGRSPASAQLSGQVLANGRAFSSLRELGSDSAYVMQEDSLTPTATVGETVAFACDVRLGALSEPERRARAAALLDDLGLAAVRDSRVGGFLIKGISGGEKRRVSIAAELAHDPALVFCDEPTSGLDSAAALSVVQTLRRLASGGRTVIVSIHQPASRVMKLFDSVCLLSGGRTLFMGPTDAASEHFSCLGLPRPAFRDAAEHFLAVAAGSATPPAGSTEKAQTPVELADAFDKVQQQQQQRAVPDDEGNREGTRDTRADHSGGFAGVLAALTTRAVRDTFRQPASVVARSAQHVMMGVFLGVLYRDVGRSQESVSARAAVNAFATAMVAMMAVMSRAAVLHTELATYRREHLGRMYSTATWVLANTLAELPLAAVLPWLFTAPMYWTVGLRDSFGRFVRLTLVVADLQLASQSLALILAALAGTTATALLLSPVAVIPPFMFAGFFVNQDSIPGVVRWLKYLSPLRYSLSAMLTNEFDGLGLQCRNSELVPDGAGGSVCPITDGSQYLEAQGITTTFWEDAFALFGLFVGFRVLFYLILMWQRPRRSTAKLAARAPATAATAPGAVEL